MPLPSNHSSDLLDKFKGKIIGHPILMGAFKQVLDLIEEPADVEVAAVIGPTGAGKSTLVDRVKQAVLKQHLTAMQGDLGLVPVITVDAPAPELGNFNWREMYLRILAELKEPACEWQIALKERPPAKAGVTRLASLNHMELKSRVESALHHRGVKVLLVDEAQHLGKMATGRRLQDQTDILKSLAKITGTFVTLVGTYDLIPLLQLNGQVARRFASIHLPRYQCDHPDEWRDFQTVIRSLESGIQLPTQPDLVKHSEMLYRGSAGCVGILKSWLTAAYSQVLRSHDTKLSMNSLKATCLPTLSLRKIIEEIGAGEDHWARSHAEDKELDRLLGLTLLHPPAVVPTATHPPRRSVPVGMRKPTRDPIGLEVVNV